MDLEFDINRFVSTQFERRTQDVPVPDLADFFAPPKAKGGKGKAAASESEGEGEANKPTPVWTVRGLTGAELAQVTEAKENNRRRAALAEGLLSSKGEQLTDAVRELLGTGDAQPDELVKRIEMLVLGSVSPACSHQLAVKLSEAYPVTFQELTNAIMRLTGLGSEPGKPRRSSGTAKSTPPSSSAT